MKPAPFIKLLKRIQSKIISKFNKPKYNFYSNKTDSEFIVNCGELDDFYTETDLQKINNLIRIGILNTMI